MRVRLVGAPPPRDPPATQDERADALSRGDLLGAIRRERARFTRAVEEPELLTMSPFYVQSGARHIVYGGTGIGKSLLVQLAAIQVALRGHKVLYFAGESYEDEFDDRTQCLLRGLGYDPDQASSEPILDTLSENFFDLSTASFPLHESHRQLDTIRDEIEPELVIFDPYVTYATGSENDVEHVRDFTVALNKLFVSRGIAVIVVHHAGKGQDGHDSETMRGSSHLPSWSQLTYRVTAQDIDAHMTRMVVECRKGRPKRKPETVAYERVLSDDLRTTWFRPASAGAATIQQPDGARPVDDTLPVDRLVPEGAFPLFLEGDDRSPTKIIRELALINEKYVFTRHEVERATGMKRTAAKELVEEMCSSGLLDRVGMIKVGRQIVRAYQYRPQK